MRFSVVLLLGVSACGCTGSDAQVEPESHPYPSHQELDIPAEGDIADPHVIRIDGTWYLYATNSKVDFEVWTSTDLVHWASGGIVWSPTPGSWNADDTQGGAWAPHVEPTPEGYYLYYTANTRIGVARADSPLGPFEEVYDHPLVGNGYGGRGDGVYDQPGGDFDDRAIDAYLYTAADGSLYLYFSANDPLSTLYAVPMRDYVSVEDVAPTLLFGPEQPWESVVCEAPVVTAHDGRIHLTYSGHIASTADYAIGGAVGDDPLGPFERYPNNPIFSQLPELGLYGPGHHCLAPGFGSDLLVFYHTKSTPKPGYDRRIRLAPAHFVSGMLQIENPDSPRQP